MTVSTTDIYVFNPIVVPLPASHTYIQVKFNAILFNPSNNPRLQLLIIDDQQANLYANTITPASNAASLVCFLASGQQQSSPVFYVSLNFESNSSLIYIQAGTLAPGDRLGISNFEIFSGNCQFKCARCDGPTDLDCLSCSGLFFFNQGTSLCETCPDRFTAQGDFCVACPYNCLTCAYNLTLGLVQCLTCDPSVSDGPAPLCSYIGTLQMSLDSLSFSNTEDWTSSAVASGLVTTCGPYSLVGGVPSGVGGSTLTKSFSGLAAHQTVWVKFSLFLIDQTPNTAYKVSTKVDGFTDETEIEIDQSLQNSDTCAGADLEYVTQIHLFDIPHTEITVTISISGLSPYFGIRDFVLGVDNLTANANCKFVLANGTCMECSSGFSLDSGCTACPAGQALADNNVCTACSIFCKTCEIITSLNNSENFCTSCDTPLFFDEDTQQCVDRQ